VRIEARVTRPNPSTARVELWLDGVPQMDWSGPIDDLDVEFNQYPPTFPSLGTWTFPVSIRRLEALALTGTAHIWRNLPAGVSAPSWLRVAPASSLGGVFSIDAEADRRAAQTILDKPNTKVGVIIADSHGLTRAVEVRPGEALPSEPFRLDAVYVYGTALGDDDLAPLAGLKHLRSIQIAGSPVGDAGIRHLHTIPWRSLKLNANKITLAGLQGFTRLERCVDIDAGFIPMTDADVTELARRAPRLHSLYVASTGVTDGVVESLAGLADLQRLGLAANPRITDAALKQLASMPRLSRLELRKTSVTPAGVAEFQKAVPTCDVDWDDPGAK
jgi:hypothetical protein